MMISRRGGNQVASSLNKWMNTLNEITIWSDNCFGQNINTICNLPLYCSENTTHLGDLQFGMSRWYTRNGYFTFPSFFLKPEESSTNMNE